MSNGQLARTRAWSSSFNEIGNAFYYPPISATRTSRRSSACSSCRRSTRGIRCSSRRSPSAWGSRRRSACGCSPIGGCGGCGDELVAKKQLYRNRHSKYPDGIAPITPAAPGRSSPPWPTCRAAGPCRFHSLRAIAAKVLELFRSLDQPPLADLPFFVGRRRVTQEVDFVTCHFRRAQALRARDAGRSAGPRPQQAPSASFSVLSQIDVP